MTMKISVRDRVALVTGAGGGLGRLYALELSKRGAKVVVNDYGGDIEGKAGTITRAQSVVDEIISAGGTAVADHGDVARDAAKIVARAVTEFGRLDIVINNAGIIGKQTSHDNVDAAAFMRVLEISVLGTTMITSAAYSIMREQGFGRVVNVSSNAIYGFGAGGDCAYGASKGATYVLTRDLGRFSVRDGIKINCVMPSAASRMTEITEGTKKLTNTYFPPDGVVPFVMLLCAEECPVSGEVFSASAFHASREVLAVYPGLNAKTPEEFLDGWNQVMGQDSHSTQPYIATSTLDQVKYLIRQVYDEEMEDIAEFGLNQ